MKTKLLVVMLLAGSSLFAETHFSIGIGVGGYGYAAPPVVAYAPPCPGPGYSWVDGYWYGPAPRRIWRSGYWAAPRYSSRYRVERRYEGYGAYGNGYNGNRYRNSYNGNRYDDRYEGDQRYNGYGRR